MFLFYVLSFFKKGDTIQRGTLFKGGHYLRKYGIHLKFRRIIPQNSLKSPKLVQLLIRCDVMWFDFYIKWIAKVIKPLMTRPIYLHKVRTFWKAHKNLRNLPHALYIYLVNVQTIRKIFFNFYVLSENPNFDTDFQLILEPLELCF